MKRFTNSRKVLFGVSVSMVLAMAIGSFALSETQTPVSPQEVEAQSAVSATVGPFTVGGGTQGTDFDYASSVLTIHSGNLTVSTTAQTSERIIVDGAATITLAGVNIDRTSETENTAALTIADNATFDVNILLADGSNNTLKGRTGSSDANPGSPGIRKNGEGDNIGKLTIGIPDGAAGTGKLDATGGYCAAGIGGGDSAAGSNITITNGEVTASGGSFAAGIGGGRHNSGSNIEITNGVVTATGGEYGAGIGGGRNNSGSNITIIGGKVAATGGQYGTGIGGGYSGSGSNITIRGGEVTATGVRTGSTGIGGQSNSGSNITIIGGKVNATGGYYGAGIGGGLSGNGSYITISGSEVTATGGQNGAGIGGGSYENGSNITISDSKVTATGGICGAGIGGGNGGSGSDITITGGVVTATGGSDGAGIGGGKNGSGSSNNILNSDAVVLATSGAESKDVFEGFVDGQGGSLITQGITFTGLGTAFDDKGHATDFSWDEGIVYGVTTLLDDLEIPVTLTVPEDSSLTINQGVTLTVPAGMALQNEGTLTVNGTVDCQYDQAAGTTGEVTTKTDFYFDDGSLYNTGYQTYQTNAGVQKYKNLPNPYQLDPANGKRLINWYYLNQASQEVAISENVNVLLNEHSFHENSIEQFTVTFSVPTGTTPAAQTVDTGSKATDPQLSWADGTVEGWYKDQAFTPANKWNFGTDTVTGNITLYAKFQCTVTFDPNYSGGSSTTGTAVYNNPVAEPTAPTRSGYRFDGWYKESACTNRWTFTTAVTRNTTLYAKWVQQFTVTFSVPTGTAPQAQNVDDGSKATDPQLIWTDGTVEGWYKEQSFTNKWNFGADTVTGDITLYAKFQCTVTFDPNYSGGSEATSQTVVYDNTVPEPDEPTRDGYSFVNWCKDEECTTTWDFENDRVQGDMTLYAKWLGNEHNVIIPTNPDDHGTVTTDPENPETGDEVIITVTPEEGYEIDGLPIVKTEDGRIIEVIPTGNPNEYKFIMPDSDVTIEVNFVLISEPTVDPGVKTGDSFAGIAALAILGLATTGAVMLRKRK